MIVSSFINNNRWHDSCFINIEDIVNTTELNVTVNEPPIPDLVDIIGFVLRHPKREQAYPGWDDASITRALINANIDRELIVTIDEDSRSVTGVVNYTVHDAEKYVFVTAVLVKKDTEAFKAMLHLLHNRWPGYTINAFRRPDNRLITYTFRQLYRTQCAKQLKPIEANSEVYVAA